MNNRGNHKHAITVLKLTRTHDGSGGDVWALDEENAVAGFGRISPMSQGELPAGMRDTVNVTHKIGLDAGLAVVKGDRIRAGGIVYLVEAVLTASESSRIAYVRNTQAGY